MDIKKLAHYLKLNLKKDLHPENHLSDLDYAWYPALLLSTKDVKRVENHMEGCFKCVSEMDRYVTWLEAGRRKEALEMRRKSRKSK